MTERVVGLRAQLAVALAVVLALTAALMLAAYEPVTRRSASVAHRRQGLILARAVAGQIAHIDEVEALHHALGQSVGEGALRAAALVDAQGRVIARAGRFELPELLSAPHTDAVWVAGERMGVSVWTPPRGVFVAECSLAPTAAERAAPKLLLFYSLSAGALALAVMYLVLTRWIVRPIESLTRTAERVAEGNREVRAPERGAAEVLRASMAFNRMTEQLVAHEAQLAARVAELERTTRELRAAQEQAARNERLATVGRLSAGIAHEVGNPLAAIVGLAEVLREGGLEEAEVTDFSQRIGHEARRIHRTVRELLDYARASPRSASDDDHAAEVADAVEQVVRLLEPQKTLRGVRFVRSIEAELPRVAVATDRLVQVLLNLSLNAGDALRNAGRARGTITFSAALVEGRVVIEVADDGPGIAEKLRDKVFEPFFTTKPTGEGTGLGLATSAAIVEQAGGALSLKASAEGDAGACFVISLPTLKATSGD
ncbi:MAG: HAMP domain-containing protein [Myxococcales bacterium]|nr:HAMP domain-containing protein [Myxococcales bacterium]